MHKDNKKCEEIMTEYISLDKNEHIPLKLSLHFLFCEKCRTQVKMLAAAEKAASAPLKLQVPLTDDSIAGVMNRVAPDAYRRMIEKPISMRRWIVSGISMIALLFVPFLLTDRLNSRNLSIAYSLLIALFVTVYCCVFVFGNIDFFIKKISTKIKLGSSI